MTARGSHTAAHLIRAIPAMIGFHPRDSLVVVGLTTAHRTGVAIRVDRVDCLRPERVRDLGRTVAVHLARAGYEQACIVSFCEGGVDKPDRAVQELADILEESVEVRDAWLVCDGRFRSQWCKDYACCPRRGLPVARDPGELAGLPRTRTTGPQPGRDPGARRRALRARERAVTARAKRGSEWDAPAYALWREAVEEALDGRMPADAVAGRLLAALDAVTVRDAIIIDMDGRGEGVCADILAGRVDARARDSLWALVEGRAARDTARIEATVDLALYLASLAAGTRNVANAAALTVAAIGHWWLGDTQSAHHLTDAALAAQPDYRLAQLVAATLLAGVHPA